MIGGAKVDEWRTSPPSGSCKVKHLVSEKRWFKGKTYKNLDWSCDGILANFRQMWHNKILWGKKKVKLQTLHKPWLRLRIRMDGRLRHLQATHSAVLVRNCIAFSFFGGSTGNAEMRITSYVQPNTSISPARVFST